MKKQVSSSCTQLTLNFEFEVTPTAPAKPSYHFSQADFDEWQATEHDIMYGRGAYIYKQIERELEFERKKILINSRPCVPPSTNNQFNPFSYAKLSSHAPIPHR